MQVETRLMQSAARTLGLDLQVINVTTDTEITPIFATLIEQQIGAIVVTASVIVRAKRDQILTLAARYGLPTMFPYGVDVRGTGGLWLRALAVTTATRSDYPAAQSTRQTVRNGQILTGLVEKS
jgi:hypothetical protein